MKHLRIKANTTVKNAEGIAKKASEWLEESGKAKSLKDIKLTQGEYPVRQFVSVKDRGMKAAWYLVSNLEAVAGRTLIKHYGKRWKMMAPRAYIRIHSLAA